MDRMESVVRGMRNKRLAYADLIAAWEEIEP